MLATDCGNEAIDAEQAQAVWATDALHEHITGGAAACIPPSDVEVANPTEAAEPTAAAQKQALPHMQSKGAPAFSGAVSAAPDCGVSA
jgi:phospholipase/lecithinase/hemolysin